MVCNFFDDTSGAHKETRINSDAVSDNQKLIKK